MSDRRVVVTGIGMATPLGATTDASWRGLTEGRSGIATLARLRESGRGAKVTIGGVVPDFDPSAWFDDRKEVQRTDRFIQLAACAAHQAWRDSGLPARLDHAGALRAGAIVGVGFGGIERILQEHAGRIERGARISAYSVPAVIANIAPAMMAIRYNLRGPNFTTSSACASGSHAIGEALCAIRDGRCDLCVAGGAEAPITELTVEGFASARALSTAREREPTRASRPFEKDRDGFVIAEGSAILILEELGRARSRGARLYAEVRGYGATCDAVHVTAPDPEGQGAYGAMTGALDASGVARDDLDVVFAHGTSTPYNDAVETAAIKRALQGHAGTVAVSAAKSMIGHTLGASGAIQTVMAALSLTTGIVPPTINYEEPDPACDLDYVPNVARHTPVRNVMVNAFGFGGTNVSLVLSRAP